MGALQPDYGMTHDLTHSFDVTVFSFNQFQFEEAVFPAHAMDRNLYGRRGLVVEPHAPAQAPQFLLVWYTPHLNEVSAGDPIFRG